VSADPPAAVAVEPPRSTRLNSLDSAPPGTALAAPSPQARMAAHLLHSRIADPAAHTAPAREAFLSRFEREVDPDGVLEPAERARRAEHARKAYFLKLALASSRARAKKRGTGFLACTQEMSRDELCRVVTHSL
jgi:hypothetical protein